MPTIRAQCVLPFRTNLPEDVITNTFHFGVDPSFEPSAWQPLLTSALSNFYVDAYALGMAVYVNGAAAVINYYDLDDPTPRVPITDPSFGTFLGANLITATTQIPTEAACVLSFQAPMISGVAQARRRGRVYLGGLSDALVTNASTTTPFFPMLEAGFITDVLDAAEDHLLAVDGTSSGMVQWAVHSEVMQQAYIVTNGWVDNTLDTQRRRGIRATTRTTFP